jgi:hypothetical protein
MMQYFRLNEDLAIPRRWHLDAVLCDGRDVSAAFLAGRMWEGRCSKLDVGLAKKGRQLDFALTNWAVPVARASLAERIREIAVRDLQAVQVAIVDSLDWCVLNCTRLVDCFDRQASEHDIWLAEHGRPDKVGQIMLVTKLRIDPARVPSDAHMFRVEGWDVPLIVSSLLKTRMEEVGCLGALFQPV